MPKAVIFDLGDTVLEERSYSITEGYDAISKHLCPRASVEELKKSITRNKTGNKEFKLLEWISAHLLNPHGLVNSQNIELELWKETVSLLPKPDIQCVLDFLVDKDIRIAAISNAIFSSSCMKVELEAHGLDKYFELILSSADHGLRKPDKEIFRLALNALEIVALQSGYKGRNCQ